MKISPSLNPSPQGRETFLSSPSLRHLLLAGGEGWERGIFETMTTLRYLLVSIIIALSVLSFAGNALCEEKPLSFTNDDIDKYRNPSDSKPQEQRKTAPSAIRDGDKKAREKQEQEYWCKRATMVKRKIESAGRDIREREDDISQEQSKSVRTSRKMNTLRSRLKKAKDQLSSAESDLSDIEREAHRKGIRPGWLRCQFD